MTGLGKDIRAEVVTFLDGRLLLGKFLRIDLATLRARLAHIRACNAPCAEDAGLLGAMERAAALPEDEARAALRTFLTVTHDGVGVNETPTASTRSQGWICQRCLRAYGPTVRSCDCAAGTRAEMSAPPPA